MSTSFPYRQLSAEVAVAGQLFPEHLVELAKLGFKSIIINRPDNEGGYDQPSSEQMIMQAKSLGLEVVYQPVVSGQIGLSDVQAFAQHLASLPKPILAYCRSGVRCTVLYQAAQEL